MQSENEEFDESRGEIVGSPPATIDATLPLPYFTVQKVIGDVALVTYRSV